MFVKASELVGALKAANLFACQDETRATMNSVHVEAVGSALRIVSTDGHTLWCCEIPARDSAADPPPAYQTHWNVRLDDVDTIVKALKGCVEVEILLSKRTIAGAVYEQRDEHFPIYCNVIPAVVNTKPGKVLPEFAASYIARCCEAFALYSKGFAPEVPNYGTKYDKDRARAARALYMDPPVAWCVAGEMDPAFFYCPKFPCAFAIVMPRKGDNIEGMIVEAFIDRVRSAKKASAA